MATASTPKSDRIEFRVPRQVKQTIVQAAAHVGQSLTDFSITALTQRAEAVIQQHEKTTLTRRDRELFLEMLDQTSPNEALRDAAKNYRQQVEAD